MKGRAMLVKIIHGNDDVYECDFISFEVYNMFQIPGLIIIIGWLKQFPEF